MRERVRVLYALIIPSMMDNFATTIEKDPATPDEIKKTLPAMRDPELTTSFIDLCADIFGDVWDEGIVELLEQFYTSEAGMRLLASWPEIMRRTNEITENPSFIKFMELLQGKVEELGGANTYDNVLDKVFDDIVGPSMLIDFGNERPWEAGPESEPRR